MLHVQRDARSPDQRFRDFMHYQLADLFEALCDSNPAAEALHAGPVSYTRGQFDERANRLAHYLSANGVKAGDHVGVYAYNRVEWIEALLACWKIRATAVNINFRYVTDELRYMWRNADMVALIYEKSFGRFVDELRADFPKLRQYLWLEDGTDQVAPLGTAYENALAGHSDKRGFAERSEDDIYLIYTGGTTGMPKGVMWRHYDFYHNVVRGGTGTESPDSIVTLAAEGHAPRTLTLSPLMHGGGQFSVIMTLLRGGVASIPVSRQFDAREVLGSVEKHRISVLNIIGDAMARPLAEAQLAAPSDVSSLRAISSGGAILTEPARAMLKRAFGEQIRLTGGIGGSEIGSAAIEAGTGEKGAGPRFKPSPNMAVLDDDLNILRPGSDAEGNMAVCGFVPIGYYNAPEKTAEVFRVDRDGKRWVIAGDRARIEADGSFTLLGRGSQCINSGGEKIYAEEVERAVALHPAVRLCAVVGVPDPKWQQRVTAVVELQPDGELTLAALQDVCRQHIAGYKVPRELVIAEFRKTPNGKIDYQWAQRTALAHVGG